MLKLLIAVDGSDHALRAVETVAKLAHQTPGLQAWLLNVRDAPVYYGELPPFDYEAIERVQLQRQQELLDMALAHARRLGLEPAAIESAHGRAGRRDRARRAGARGRPDRDGHARSRPVGQPVHRLGGAARRPPRQRAGAAGEVTRRCGWGRALRRGRRQRVAEFRSRPRRHQQFGSRRRRSAYTLNPAARSRHRSGSSSPRPASATRRGCRA
jgi:hypothetical protein